MSITADREDAVLFGPFRLLPAQRLLLQGERPVRLGSRALDLLVALIRRAGETVTKPELAATVWPGVQIVGEGTIRVHVLELRKALGDGQDGRRYVSTVAGRGYCFVGSVTWVSNQASPPAPRTPAVQDERSLPSLPTRVIGRDVALAAVASQLTQSRLVTVVGTAGIGKTTLALAVAESAGSAYADGVWFIDLARVREASLVASAVATELGIEVGSADPTERLLSFARDRRMLLLIDNCEHVIDAAATITSQLLRDAPDVYVLATSRERLRVRGERVYRLAGLDSPPTGTAITADEALAYPAVQLFVERAAACFAGFELTDLAAPAVGEICSRLDGIALAIELAAARVEDFGVGGLAAGLDDRFRLLSRGSRTETDRHRTLRGALDWSYRLLSYEEQTIFRRLAVFAGGFTLQAASAVTASTGDGSEDVPEIVADLVAKSLAATDLSGGDVRFQLLETMGAYALSKLAESGEAAVIGRRHAQYYRDLMQASLENPGQGNLAAAYRPEIDNIRAALAWAFSPGGDGSLAVGLAAASTPLWLEMSLLSECRGWMEMALDRLDAGDRGKRLEIVLQCALGLSLITTQGMVDKARTALMTANELAEGFEDAYNQLRALGGLWICYLRSGEFQEALALSHRAEAIAGKTADPVPLQIADGLLCTSHFHLGHYAEASRYAKRVYRRSAPAVRRALMVVFGLDISITSGVFETHVFWLQGLLDQSAQMASAVLAEAETIGHPVSLAFALAWYGCLPSLVRGDLEAAKKLIKQLKHHAAQYGLGTYDAYRLCFEGQLSAKRGEVEIAEHQLRASLAALQQAQVQTLYTVF